MSLSLVTGPTLEPVSLLEAKEHCRVSISDDDGLLAGYLIAARDFAEGFIGRKLMTQTWDVRLDWFPSCIEVPIGPLQSVTYIQYVDTAGATQTLSSAVYQVDASSLVARIAPAYQQTWPTIRDQMNAVTLRVVVGYGSNPGDVPESIRQAILMLVGHWYENRETINVGNITGEIPFSARALLWPNRVFY